MLVFFSRLQHILMVFLSYIRMQCLLCFSYQQEMTLCFHISSLPCPRILSYLEKCQKSESSSFLQSDLALITDLINGAIDTYKYQISYANNRAAKTCPRLESYKGLFLWRKITHAGLRQDLASDAFQVNPKHCSNHLLIQWNEMKLQWDLILFIRNWLDQEKWM